MRKIVTNLLIEFGPTLAFVLTYIITNDFFDAVLVMLVVTVASVVVADWLQRRFALFPALMAILVVVFGGLSLYFQNETYVILQDTISNGLFALVLLGSARAGRPLMKDLFDQLFAISDRAWLVLTWRWGMFYGAVAICNEVLRWQAEPWVWVWFKGLVVVATIIFGSLQFRLAKRERLPYESSTLGFRIATLPRRIRKKYEHQS